MIDRFKYAEVRKKIVDAVRIDLMGPISENEVLSESPKSAYIIGVLEPQDIAAIGDMAEQEVDTDISYDGDEDYTAGQDDENEPISSTNFKTPSSLGISFYIESITSNMMVDVSWADYVKSTGKRVNKEGKETDTLAFQRIPVKETIEIDFSAFNKSKEYRLIADSNISVYVSRITLKGGYSLVSVYVTNKRKNAENDIEGSMFQTKIRAYGLDDAPIFVAEHICRGIVDPEEYFFEKRPILGRGRGCAATWSNIENGRATYVESEFIPEYEFAGVSPALDRFDQFFFSMRELSVMKKKDTIIEKLLVLTSAYKNWIDNKLKEDARMESADFKNKVGDEIISACENALQRMVSGIELIKTDDTVLDAFCFMNRAMLLQTNIKNYSKKYGERGIECSFTDFTNPNVDENNFGWRPFQIAFILMNLKGLVNPLDKEREIVDLLYFPTGGGKTEAYLGLMAFTIAYRRLTQSDSGPYNNDGGVTAILRYTLRLLTTQQRDRITKMVVAAEMIREKSFPKYGAEPISIGFWVGGQVTPNKFDELKDNPEKPYEATRKRNMLFKQLLNCPFCGKPLTEDEFYIHYDKKSVDIYCADSNCIFYKYKPEKKAIPVYLIDEEIYAKCPTIILSTVDKFARLPWDEKTNALFGRVDRKCSRHGYIAIGEEHSKHNRSGSEPAATLEHIRPFLPPQLIIQDELHLITGPLGTVYGAYETIIEDMCSYAIGDKKVSPKYVVSTATIKNADAQAKCLYARRDTKQFPPNGFEIGDSFFVKEISTEENPFRNYLGVCAQGQSVKTTLLRTYAIILQTVRELVENPEYKDCIDPYYSLVGYYNSIRELGGAVRLLQDDIPKRIHMLKKKYNHSKERYLNRREEITSRMSSYDIPRKLKELEATYDSGKALDTAVATNMIAVGMDVDRLGLMAVTGQPKQNSEYIQATSRIGRNYPGLVVTIYNPYRPRDLSHYENFTGYHSQLYRFVEGTTATPFSARARDRVLHAIVIAAIRLKYPEFAGNAGANNINDLTDTQLQEVKSLILDRLNIIKPEARTDADEEISQFIDLWRNMAHGSKELRYYVVSPERYNRLMNFYNAISSYVGKPTLNSMREVENSANMYYYTED